MFKTRTEHDRRLASSVSDTVASANTVQRMGVTVGSGGVLLVLVDPVTCFRAASYVQQQTFRLAHEASVVVLDWLTAGRMSRDEKWAFARYHSVNEVWQGGRRVARDAMRLEQRHDATPLPARTLEDRLGPYGCYATALMFGPAVAGVVAKLTAAYDRISQMQRRERPTFVWSMSLLDGGCIVRAAGLETEAVREWLRDTLREIEAIVGRDVYSRAFV